MKQIILKTYHFFILVTAIDQHLPVELQSAVTQANADDDVRVIVLSGSGRSFCAGYDLKMFAEGAERGSTLGKYFVCLRNIVIFSFQVLGVGLFKEGM